MTLSIFINGAKGRMGQQTVHAVTQDPELELVGTADHGDDLAALLGEKKPNIAIDFTNANSAYDVAQIIVNANVRPVIGTTGFTAEQIAQLQAQCETKQLGGIIAPNFSLGAVLMMQLAQQVAHYFPHVEILEYHHENKQDAPSGTALKTAEMITAQQSIAEPAGFTHNGARGFLHHDIPIHAIRLPGHIADQTVLFGGQGETLKIEHQTINRACFMPGVLFACKKVMDLHALVYGLEQVL